jgi:hypothetical protein
MHKGEVLDEGSVGLVGGDGGPDLFALYALQGSLPTWSVRRSSAV